MYSLAEVREALRGEAGIDARLDVAEALRHIPRKYAQALVLWGQGYSKREVCRKLGVCGNGVYVLRAEKRLMEALNGS